METGMIAIAAALFAAILIPTLLIIKNTKQQSQKLLNGLKAIVAANNGVLSQHTEQSNFALGIDNSAKTVYFFKQTEDGEMSQVIDLTQVTSCEIITQKRRIKKENGFEEMVDSITLVFPTNNNGERKEIELYNENDSLLNDEIAIAEDWKKAVQHILMDKKEGIEQQKDQKFTTVVAA